MPSSNENDARARLSMTAWPSTSLFVNVIVRDFTVGIVYLQNILAISSWCAFASQQAAHCHLYLRYNTSRHLMHDHLSKLSLHLFLSFLLRIRDDRESTMIRFVPHNMRIASESRVYKIVTHAFDDFEEL